MHCTVYNIWPAMQIKSEKPEASKKPHNVILCGKIQKQKLRRQLTKPNCIRDVQMVYAVYTCDRLAQITYYSKRFQITVFRFYQMIVCRFTVIRARSEWVMYNLMRLNEPIRLESKTPTYQMKLQFHRVKFSTIIIISMICFGTVY